MTIVNAARLEEWLDADTYPNSVWQEYKGKKNYMLRQPHDILPLADLIEAEKNEELELSAFVYGLHGSKPFKITFNVSKVIIEEFCPDKHDWGEWKYDFMGGDLRTCKVCNATEYT